MRESSRCDGCGIDINAGPCTAKIENMATYAMWLVLVFSFVCCVVSQAPGDGDPLCVDEVIDGDENPFFAQRPTYADNVRPLMDSRDYVVLLAGDDMAHIPWQQVDNDNNNSNTIVTEVSFLIHVNVCSTATLRTRLTVTARCVYFVFPVVSTSSSIMPWYSYSVWLW